MVLAVDPYALRSMITGGYDERLSPEARNARPFYHLLPRWGARRTPPRARRRRGVAVSAPLRAPAPRASSTPRSIGSTRRARSIAAASSRAGAASLAALLAGSALAACDRSGPDAARRVLALAERKNETRGAVALPAHAR